jgi:hypothetical protein
LEYLGLWFYGISILLPKVLPQVLLVENTQQRHSKFFAQMEDQQRQKELFDVYRLLSEVLPQVMLVENTQQRCANLEHKHRHQKEDILSSTQTLHMLLHEHNQW